jgi:hypothetical protein
MTDCHTGKADTQTDRQTHRQTGRQAEIIETGSRQIDRLKSGQTDMETSIWTDRQKDGQTDRQTQAYKWTDRQTEVRTDI